MHLQNSLLKQALNNPKIAEKLLKDVKKEQATRSLAEFYKQAWSVFDPAQYKHNWHIDCICEHLEAVTRGEIDRLLINMPPRHSKSSIVGVSWPAWVWTQKQLEKDGVVLPTCGASAQFLYLSYAQSLSTRDNVKTRQLIESQWYQKNWGDKFKFKTDVNLKTIFANTENGYRMASSIGGVATGEGGSVIVLDDPHNVKQTDSDKVREEAVRVFREVLPSRLNDPAFGAFVCVMQRIHEKDISGHILENDMGYTHVCLPAEYEQKHPFIFMGDMREKEGELLWPDHYGPDQLKKLKKGLTERAVAGQLQQRPSLAEGTYFKRDWFHWFDEVPKHLRIYGASDYAVTDEGGDYTVHLVVGVDPDDNIYILDIWREQTNSNIWVEAFLDLGIKYKPLIWGEEKGQIIKSLGPYVEKRARERKAYFRREQFASVADKPTRCRSFQARASQGKVYLPKEASWLDELINELLMFPAGAYDDQVDALSLIGQMLDAMIGGTIPVKTESNKSGYSSSKRRGSNSWKLA